MNTDTTLTQKQLNTRKPGAILFFQLLIASTPCVVLRHPTSSLVTVRTLVQRVEKRWLTCQAIIDDQPYNGILY